MLILPCSTGCSLSVIADTGHMGGPRGSNLLFKSLLTLSSEPVRKFLLGDDAGDDAAALRP